MGNPCFVLINSVILNLLCVWIVLKLLAFGVSASLLVILCCSSFKIRQCAVLLPLVWSRLLILKHQRKTLDKIIANKKMGHIVGIGSQSTEETHENRFNRFHTSSGADDCESQSRELIVLNFRLCRQQFPCFNGSSGRMLDKSIACVCAHVCL